MSTDSTIHEATSELREILEELYFVIEEDGTRSASTLAHMRDRYTTAIRRVREVELRYDRDTGKVEGVTDDA